MNKKSKPAVWLVVFVLFLTIFNILPSIFYYSKPLGKPVDEPFASEVLASCQERLLLLESETIDWIKSLCTLLNTPAQKISIEENNGQLVKVVFSSQSDASRFKKYLPRASAFIPFAPGQLSIYDMESADMVDASVFVQRKIPITAQELNLAKTAVFTKRYEKEGEPTPFYQNLVFERAERLLTALLGESDYARTIARLENRAASEQGSLMELSTAMITASQAFQEKEKLDRFWAYFLKSPQKSPAQLIAILSAALEETLATAQKDIAHLAAKKQELLQSGGFLSSTEQQELDNTEKNLSTWKSAASLAKEIQKEAAKNPTGLDEKTIRAQLHEGNIQKSQVQISLNDSHPFFRDLLIDWDCDRILLPLYESLSNSKKTAASLGAVDQLFLQTIHALKQATQESFDAFEHAVSLPLSRLPESGSLLAFDLEPLARAFTEHLKKTIVTQWHPTHPDLIPTALPIYSQEEYEALLPEEQDFALVVYAPLLDKAPWQGFKNDSIYVVAKGLYQLWTQAASHAELSSELFKELSQLQKLLQKNGFFGYLGQGGNFEKSFAQDFIFEAPEYFQPFLAATRENFVVQGNCQYAVIEFSTYKQALKEKNRIDDQAHEDLLKWRDDYYAAQNGLRGLSKQDVPKPTRNVYWDNFCLSAKKFFRGDERKILYFGLDLIGGKTVQVELLDSDGHLITDRASLELSANELYSRVNRMGLSDAKIRQEGHYITLDFPGAQDKSAKELVQASSMQFHVIQEQFGPKNPALAQPVNDFLQQVWNQMLLEGRTDSLTANAIAQKMLYGEALDPDNATPENSAAKILWENKLRFELDPFSKASSQVDEEKTKIVRWNGGEATQWQGQSHPLMFVFRNFVLEGGSLENIVASYDQTKGNFLSFSIKKQNAEGRNPQEDLHAWTSIYAKEQMENNPLAEFSQGNGWRMAVILNNEVISSPVLDSPLKDHVMISGSFTQKEILQLETDLKAGALTFSPQIVSESNVSAEMGAKSRQEGIIAMCGSLLLVFLIMATYYRLGGVIAFVAVLFNLCLLWAGLQNMQAALSFAGIAGIILTVGMAVDANVLIFERIREELQAHGKLTTAVYVGYKKAFSAILDSNITTVIAALVLLQFNSGPIKGFALTLIIGILSSMFTALFATRTFFFACVQSKKITSLSFCDLFHQSKINFLKYARPILLGSFLVISGGAFFGMRDNSRLLGMDFTGGKALTLHFDAEQQLSNIKEQIEKIFLAHHLHAQDFQVRELASKNDIRIFLSPRVDLSSAISTDLSNSIELAPYGFEENKNLSAVVHMLAAGGLVLPVQELQNLETRWMSVSGQVSSSMCQQALWGIAFVLVAILLYITLRFQASYAWSATTCVALDLFFTSSALVLLNKCGLPLQIDLNTVAALMTIIGYSLNNTIIVFDRIREQRTVMKRSALNELVLHALNATLGRTLLTSGTTMAVLLPLLFLGRENALFGFTIVLMVGILFGTLSSLCVAPWLLLRCHKKNQPLT